MSKILLLDIETFPNTVRTWGTYKQHVLEVLEYPIVCGYSAKWLGGQHVTKILPDFPKYKVSVRDDSRIVKEVWKLLDEADIIIAHFGDGFDIPFLNARFAAHGLAPPTPYRTIDTKKVVSKHFHFGGSYKLDHVCQYLGLGKKIKHNGYDLWEGCMSNDPKAWKTMRTYNRHDVTLLEALYLHLRPWIKDHPSLFIEGGCSRCGSVKLQSRGRARSSTREYHRFQCQSCGGWLRGTKSVGKVTIVSA